MFPWRFPKDGLRTPWTERCGEDHAGEHADDPHEAHLGSASVGGYDVVREAAKIRSLIGVVPQENNLDRYLTARENLILHAKMHRMSPSSYQRRIDELLSLMGLVERQKDFPTNSPPACNGGSSWPGVGP